MAQFDVYRNLNPASQNTIPYLLDVQADLLASLNTRVVVPLVLADEMGLALKQLHLRFTINGMTLILSTGELAGLPLRTLGEKITSLKNNRDEIIAALDFLVTGI